MELLPASLEESMNLIDSVATHARRQTLELTLRIQALERERDLALLAASATSASAIHSDVQDAFGQQHGSFVAVLLDGDGCLFRADLIARGKEGGKNAARQLSQEIMRTIPACASRPLLVFLACNKSGLARALESRGICRPNGLQVSQFFVGFCEASPLFSVVDAGTRKEATDHKIRAFLNLYAALPACCALVFGGTHDASYLAALEDLGTRGILGKVWLLKYAGYLGVFSKGTLKDLRQRTIGPLHSTFAPQKLDSTLRVSPAIAPRSAARPPALRDASEANHPRQLAQLSRRQPLLTSPKTSTTPISSAANVQNIWQRQPRPCLDFYLATCPSGNQLVPHQMSCKFSHDHVFSDQELATLRKEALALPCLRVSKGAECHDPACFRAHACPLGGSCTHGASCFFKGFGQHPSRIPSDCSGCPGANAEAENAKYLSLKGRDLEVMQRWQGSSRALVQHEVEEIGSGEETDFSSRADEDDDAAPSQPTRATTALSLYPLEAHSNDIPVDCVLSRCATSSGAASTAGGNKGRGYKTFDAGSTANKTSSRPTWKP